MTHERPRSSQQAFEAITLAKLHDIIWSLLAEGVEDASSPFHTPALATVGDDEPDVRTVVLRHADPAMRQISCHTDWRSPKRSQVENHSRVSWMFYDRGRKLQLRCCGQGVLHKENALAHQRWTSSPPRSRMCYSSPLAPGTSVGSPMEAPKNPESGWQNFTVLTCVVDYMDWLFLRAGGHRRAIFRWHHSRWRGEWVAP